MAPPASPASPSNFLSPCSSLQQFPATRCTVLCVFLCSSYSLCLGFPLPILCLANPFSLRLDSVSPLGAYHIPQLSSCSPQDPYDLECITLCHSCLLPGSFPGPGSPLHPQHPAQGPTQSRYQGTFVELSQCPEPSSLLRYWKLDPAQVYASRPNAWDTAVHDASEEYKHRMVGELHPQETRVGTRLVGSPTARPDHTLLASPAQPLL